MQNIDMSSCHLIHNANVYLTIPEKKKSFYYSKDESFFLLCQRSYNNFDLKETEHKNKW